MGELVVASVDGDGDCEKDVPLTMSTRGPTYKIRNIKLPLYQYIGRRHEKSVEKALRTCKF